MQANNKLSAVPIPTKFKGLTGTNKKVSSAAIVVSAEKDTGYAISHIVSTTARLRSP